MIQFDASAWEDTSAAAQREWLETNGLGGFAMSSIIGLNTRKYHGLLIAATHPPAGRAAMLSKLEEVLILKIDGAERRFELSCNQYPGVVFPQGYQLQTGFRLDPHPVYTYVCDGVTVEKSVFVVHGENTVAVRYTITGPADKLAGAALDVRPLIAFRDYHQLVRMNQDVKSDLVAVNGLLSIKPYDHLPQLHFAHDATRHDARSDWYNAFNYLVEKDRGYDYVEDLYNPFALVFERDAAGAAPVWECRIIASTIKRDVADLPRLREAEVARRRAIKAAATRPDGLSRALAQAADQFIVRRGDGYSLIAGYPWFTDWGRDSMICLPGLVAATDRRDVARSILTTFAGVMSQGMIPNRFLASIDLQAGEEMEYNTIDGTLWMFEAVRALVEHTGDRAFVKAHLYDALKDAVDWYEKGTRYHIRVDDDGLVTGGEEGVQLTWMDAKVNTWVVTPRYGKPVEVQALWYNALRVLQGLAQDFDDADTAARCAELAERAHDSFNRDFWNEAAGCLYDVISPEGTPDASIRPNQILAVSLTHSMLSPERARQVVEIVRRDLLTPLGLRSLAPSDYNYRGRYEGNLISRDSAYHQGTVWSWLIGPFITAHLKTSETRDDARAEARGWLAAFEEHLGEAGLGQISEIFDGNAPHAPRGTIAQAWSVFELLRVIAEDLS